MRRALVFGLDLLISAAALVALAILATGGGVFAWEGHVLRAERARTTLWILLGLVLLRYAAGTRVAFLARWDLGRWRAAAARGCARLTQAMSALSPRQARRVLLGILILSAAPKLWNVYHHYGFSLGDDVEIHLLSFSAIHGQDLGVWALRNPVYPLVFIYPVQRLLVAAGVNDPGSLILAGRLVVVAFSLVSVWLCYRIGSTLFGMPAVGLWAAYLLAISRLHVRMASSEEPRTLAAMFLLVCFGALSAGRGAGRAALAGGAFGVAAGLRFSEAIFAVPLGLQLLSERRFRDLLVAGAASLLVLAVILGPGDLLFWPEMFSSLRHIVDFTLVRGESSRGFEPLAHYLTTAFAWSDPFTLLLVAVAWRASPWSLRLWAFTPILVLSLFPHKEERYLLPALPFLMLMAGRGAWRLLEGARSAPSSGRVPLAALVLCGATLFQVEGFRYRRSEAAIDAARFVAARRGVRTVAMEEATTTTGAVLYLRPAAQVVSIDTDKLGVATYFWAVISRPETQYVVLREKSLRPGYDALLSQQGFTELRGPQRRHRERYRVFLRRGGPR